MNRKKEEEEREFILRLGLDLGHWSSCVLSLRADAVFMFKKTAR